MSTKPGSRGALGSTISAYAVICGTAVLVPPFEKMLTVYLKVSCQFPPCSACLSRRMSSSRVGALPVKLTLQLHDNTFQT